MASEPEVHQVFEYPFAFLLSFLSFHILAKLSTNFLLFTAVQAQQRKTVFQDE
jgi:hypothetical protein